MSGNKTRPTGASVGDFLAAAPPAKAQDAQRLDTLFRAATGFVPQMWGRSIVGCGRYHYRYASGRAGGGLATGFSPRKAAFSIYIMPGYQDYGAILSRLGKHKTGKSCLYVNKLADVDLCEQAGGCGPRGAGSAYPAGCEGPQRRLAGCARVAHSFHLIKNTPAGGNAPPGAYSFGSTGQNTPHVTEHPATGDM